MLKERHESVARMSVEQPLWRALTGYRVLTMVYAVLLFGYAYQKFQRPWVAIGYLTVLTGWTLATIPRVANAASCTKRFLGADLTVALAGILLTPVADSQARIMDGRDPAVHLDGGPRPHLRDQGRLAVGRVRLLAGGGRQHRRARQLTRDTVHNVLLVWVASVAIGYVVEVARASERTLARALEIEAATRERERLARDIHDSVLQVLAMVQRRGTALGGEAAELGRMAGEQESRPADPGLQRPGARPKRTRGDRRSAHHTAPPATPAATPPAGRRGRNGRHGRTHAAPCDVRALLSPTPGRGSPSPSPGAPVVLPGRRGHRTGGGCRCRPGQCAGAHAGGDEAHAWILVEDEPDAVIVTYGTTARASPGAAGGRGGGGPDRVSRLDPGPAAGHGRHGGAGARCPARARKWR